MTRCSYLCLLLTVFSGCASTIPKEEITLDPLVLRLDKSGGVTIVDARPLFKEASEDYKRSKYKAAARKFHELVTHFPKSRYVPHAMFNGALAHMKLKEWSAALSWLEGAFERLKGTDDHWDIRLQMAICFEATERWPEAIVAFDEVLKNGKLHIVERIETKVRLGLAYHKAGDIARAERSFKAALKRYKANLDIPRLKGNAYVAQAQYTIGKIYKRLFQVIKFRLPVESMKRDLLDKSAFFLKSQAALLHCIRLRNPYYSVAAGFQLGKLYEDMFDDMMAAEIPGDLNKEEKELYYEELKKHIRPLVVRAIEIYERNLSMSDRVGDGVKWAKKTQKSLDRMHQIFKVEFNGLQDDAVE